MSARPLPPPVETFAATRALCNLCGRLTDARIAFQGEEVWLEKHCLEHGPSRTLVSTDRAGYLLSLGFVKPGQDPRARAVRDYRGCPGSCGLCPAHQQHTCVPILELTGRCDLDCPVCLVHGQAQPELGLEDVRRVVAALLGYEGRLHMLNLSGGEPTAHPRFLEIVEELAARPEIGVLSVSTNGLRLGEDERLARRLAELKVVVSLQVDGLAGEGDLALRGRPGLAALKRRALERVLAAGGRLSLVYTLERGVNEAGLAEVLALLFSNDAILSLMVQPLAHARRAPAGDLREVRAGLTTPEVVGLLVAASGGVLEPRDLTPLPCSHPACFSLTYLLRARGGKLVSLPRLVDADTYLDAIKNQALLRTDPEGLQAVKDALYKLWSSSGVIPDREDVLATVKQLLLDLQRVDPRGPLRDGLELGLTNVKSIFIHSFMDRYTFDLSRAMKCCNHYPQADGRMLPACMRNVGLAR
ncbi:MAG TPA: radical SAM protein [Myxococcota bacterium]|nr:radical SAM protein [Myxococcota bacterium]HRY95805.1 radical SAM protein [Myxococcota bacterium]HSA22763.1 radical SAM protein [Myxococcota bacterium]